MKRLFISVVLIAFMLFDAAGQALPKTGAKAKSCSIIATMQGLKQYAKDDFVAPTSFVRCSIEEKHTILSKSDTLNLIGDNKEKVWAFYQSLGWIEGVTVIKSFTSPSLFTNSLQETGIFLGAFSLDVVYNTQRTEEISRAKDAIKSGIIPVIQKGAKSIKDLPYKQVMIAVAYGIRDFTDSYSAEGACVICAFNISDIADFTDLELTEDELINKSAVYVRDQSEIKKVNIN